jgi:hypothetical protein
MPNPPFYTYVLLDPRKKGNYIYNGFSFDYEPFYFGKGINGRCNDHISEAINTDKNRPKLNKIRKILKVGRKPIIVKVLENIDEQTAFDNEIESIAEIGRADLGLGPLTNLTDGGEGVSGRIMSDEEKKLRSQILTGIKKPPRTDEHNKNLGNAVSEAWQNKLEEGFEWSDETINKRAESNRGQTRTDEQKQRMSVSQIIYCSDEKVREMKSEISLEYYSSEEGEQTKQQISANLVSFYDTEEGQALKDHLSSINTGENNPLYGTKNSVETIEKRAATRKKNGHWQISEEELFESFSNGQKKRFSDPEERRKQSERLKGRRWYNNGKQQGQYHPDKRPDGWELGRLR